MSDDNEGGSGAGAIIGILIFVLIWAVLYFGFDIVIIPIPRR
jgi:hypothetical protein